MLFSWAPAAFAGPVDLDAPVPAWVEPIEVASSLPGEGDNVHWLVVDAQVRASADTLAIYNHFAYRVTSPEGVEEHGDLSFRLAPWQSLDVHSVRVLRGEQVIEVDLSQLVAGPAQSDPLLARYDQATVYGMTLPLSPGDVVDKRFTISGFEPSLGRPSLDLQTGWGEAVGHRGVRVWWSGDAPTVTQRGRPLERVDGPDGVRLSGSFDDVPAVPLPPSTPTGRSPYTVHDFSGWQDWAQVARHGAGLFDGTIERDPEEGDLAAEARRIVESHPERLEQITAAVRLIQEGVRQPATGAGFGGFAPRRPSEVLRERVGRGHDKATALVALLRALGVPAQVALVNSDYRGRVALRAPGLNSMDHALVRFEHEGAWHWVDPTRQYQRGPATSAWVRDYGLALVLAPETTGLAPLFPGERPHYHFETHYHIDAGDFEAPATLVVTTRHQGGAADALRQSTAEHGPPTAESYASFYDEWFPERTSLAPFEVSDDVDANVITVVERWEIEDYWVLDDEGTWRGPASAFDLYGTLKEVGAEPREVSLHFEPTGSTTVVVEIEVPEVEWDMRCDAKVVLDPAFEARTSCSGSGTTWRQRWTFEPRADEVLPEAHAAFVAHVTEARDSFGVDLYHQPPTELSGAGVALAAACWLGSLALFLLLVVAVVGGSIYVARQR